MADGEGFWKRHGFLVAGVALPLLVVVAFVLARTLPRMWVPEPKYDALYTTRTGYDSQPSKLDRRVFVANGRLRVAWTRVENPIYLPPLRVWRLRASTGAAELVPVAQPPDPEAVSAPMELEVEGLEGFRVEASPTSPDGYEFENRTRYGSGLFDELLIRRRHGPGGVIAKGGRVIPLPQSDTEPYGSTPVEFLGWLVPAEPGR